jgi:hypothetical protein
MLLYPTSLVHCLEGEDDLDLAAYLRLLQYEDEEADKFDDEIASLCGKRDETPKPN